MSWVLLIGTSFLFGMLVVQYLVSGVRRTSASIAGAGLLFLGVDVGQVTHFLAGQSLLAAPVGILSAGAGYAFMTGLAMHHKARQARPVLKRERTTATAGHRAIILLSAGEAPEYDAQMWIDRFREADQRKARSIPFLARPLYLYRLRQRYAAAGKSQNRSIHLRMVQALQNAYRESGDAATRFYPAFIHDHPHADEAAIQALNEGAGELIVAGAFLTQSDQAAEVKESIERLHPADYGVKLRFTRPLWDSNLLMHQFVERIHTAAGETRPEQVGVLLISNPRSDHLESWSSERDAQEMTFRNAIYRQLLKQCYPQKNLKMSWLKGREPGMKRQLNEFARQCTPKVIACATDLSADGLPSQVDIPAGIQSAHLPANTQVICLGGWNDHPLVIQGIKERIDEITRD